VKRQGYYEEARDAFRRGDTDVVERLSRQELDRARASADVAAEVPKFSARFGPRPFLITGGVFLTTAMAWLTRLSASSDYLTSLAPPLVLFGLGGGMLYMPLSAVLLAGVPSEERTVDA
jgi:hypothetical protein